MTEYFKDTLANGLRLVTVEMPHLHSVEMVCHVGVGGRHEQHDKAGISHFLEHMLFRGTHDYPTGLALESAFEALGGTANAATDGETTCYHSRLHPEHVAEGTAIFASLLRRTLLSDIDIERRIILEEALEDLNEAGEEINPDNLTCSLLWPDHPLSLPTVGTHESVQNLTREDLQQHLDTWYTPGNIVIAIAGRVTREQALAAVEAAFGDWQDRPVPTALPAPTPLDNGPLTVWTRDASSQIQLQLAFNVPGRNDPRTPALRLIRRILSGSSARLMVRLREQLGLTYHAEANLGLYDDCGVFSIDLAVAPTSLMQALQEVLLMLDDLRNNPAGEEELQRVVRTFVYEQEFSLDQADTRAGRFGWGELVGYPLTLAEECRQVQALTAAQVRDVAAQLLDPKALAVAFVGPFNARQRKEVEKLLAGYVDKKSKAI
ncbi:MAG: M16 family metallopeptidase [Pedobacter sp.]